MKTATEYEARLDAKLRIRLAGAKAKSYQVSHRRDGSIVLRPLGVVKIPSESLNTPAARKTRFDATIAAAKAKGEKIPAGVYRVDFRNLTPREEAFAKRLGERRQKASA